MLLTIAIPAALDLGGEARVRLVHAAAGDMLAPGAKLIDFNVDLSAGAAHDCPPISHYRLVLRERGWLRRLAVATGDPLMAGATIGWIGDAADTPLDEAAARAARVTVASILFHAEGWGGRP